MNVTELARRLRVHPKKMLEILPQHGFDIGAKAIKVDDRTATKIMRAWRHIKKKIDEEERKRIEEEKLKLKEQRKQSGVSVTLPEIVTVRQFAELLGLSVTQVITDLMKNGILANQNQNIDRETAALMAEEFGFTVKEEEQTEEPIESQIEQDKELVSALERGDNKTSRAPVIVVMGHVDHGKTKLLDTVREADITASEHGGITQHIGAYQTIWKDPKSKEERALTFIDTPGHEAFTVMRSRGAMVADLAILVVAADDGVKQQTEEVIQIIKAAKLPFVVAINKIDKDAADADRVRGDLAKHDIVAEDWGGNTPMVEISAKNNINIDKLLDTLLLVADVQEEGMKADPSIPAVGTVIESHTDKGVGPVATVLVQTGTLHKGDQLAINGEIYGKVRAMRDHRADEITVAGPSVPAQIIGFKVTPQVGDILDVRTASDSKKIDIKQKRSDATGAQKTLTSRLEEEDEDEKKKYLKLLIKADVLGSLEAIIGSLERLQHDEVGVKIVGKGLGNINDGDVGKAEATGAHMIGFNVNPASNAEIDMKEKGISFARYDVIYDLMNWVKEKLGEMLSDETIVTEEGNLKVLAIFRREKKAMTVGGRVENGKAVSGAKVRIKRDGEIIGEGTCNTLQSGPSVVKQVPAGSECGVGFVGKDEILEGDVLEFYTEFNKARTIVFE